VVGAELSGGDGVKKPKETDLVRALLAYLRAVPGVDAWRCNQGAARLPGRNGKEQLVRFSHRKGISDIIGWVARPLTLVTDGGACWSTVARFLAIEAKMPGNRPTKEQQAFLDAVQAAGGVGLLCYSVADLEAGLRAAGVTVAPPRPERAAYLE
jgi:hypothetical protein